MTNLEIAAIIGTVFIGIFWLMWHWCKSPDLTSGKG